MYRVPVSSSNLSSVGYDPLTQTLEVQFHSGWVYQYSNVPQHIYQGLMSAASHGKYLAAYIKNVYPYRRVA